MIRPLPGFGGPVHVFLTGMVLTSVAVAATGCAWISNVAGGSPSRLLVVLVDVSSSTDRQNWELARKAYTEAVSVLEPGDRFVLAGITDASLTRFAPVVDRVLPVRGIHMDDQDAAKAAREDLAGALESFSETKAPRTRIVDAIEAVARQVISVERTRQPVLLILSDMLEVSEHFNFERAAPPEEAVDTFVEARRAQHALPELSGTIVYVVGATAPTERHYRLVERFWTGYFEATGASMALYGRTVPGLRD